MSEGEILFLFVTVFFKELKDISKINSQNTWQMARSKIEPSHYQHITQADRRRQKQEPTTGHRRRRRRCIAPPPTLVVVESNHEYYHQSSSFYYYYYE